MAKNLYIYTKTSTEWLEEYNNAYKDLLEFQANLSDVKSVKNDGDELTYNSPIEILRIKQNLLKVLKKEYEKALAYENGSLDNGSTKGLLYIGREYGY